MNKKLITGTITLAALLGIGASVNNTQTHAMTHNQWVSGQVDYAKQHGLINNNNTNSATYTTDAQGNKAQILGRGASGFTFKYPNSSRTYSASYNSQTAKNLGMYGNELSNRGTDVYTYNNGNSNNQSSVNNASNNNINQSTQYANKNTLPQTSESKNAKDVALAGLSALAVSVALIGADPAKEAMKNKMVDRRLKYGI